MDMLSSVLKLKEKEAHEKAVKEHFDYMKAVIEWECFYKPIEARVIFTGLANRYNKQFH